MTPVTLYCSASDSAEGESGIELCVVTLTKERAARLLERLDLASELFRRCSSDNGLGLVKVSFWFDPPKWVGLNNDVDLEEDGIDDCPDDWQVLPEGVLIGEDEDVGGQLYEHRTDMGQVYIHPTSAGDGGVSFFAYAGDLHLTSATIHRHVLERIAAGLPPFEERTEEAHG